jgi:hypothetical protein
MPRRPWARYRTAGRTTVRTILQRTFLGRRSGQHRDRIVRIKSWGINAKYQAQNEVMIKGQRTTGPHGDSPIKPSAIKLEINEIPRVPNKRALILFHPSPRMRITTVQITFSMRLRGK